MDRDETEIYVLVSKDIPVIGHTTQQGAAMEMVNYPPEKQKEMFVSMIVLVDDHAS